VEEKCIRECRSTARARGEPTTYTPLLRIMVERSKLDDAHHHVPRSKDESPEEVHPEKR